MRNIVVINIVSFYRVFGGTMKFKIIIIFFVTGKEFPNLYITYH